MNNRRTRNVFAPSRPSRPRAMATGLLLLAAFAVPSLAQALDRLPFSDPLADAALDQQRGGFRIGNLEISIGLEQVVAINGDIQVVNRLVIPNLNQSIRDGVLEQLVEINRPASGQPSGSKPVPASQPAAQSSSSVAQAPSAGSNPQPSATPAGNSGTTVSVPTTSTIASQPAIVAASELRNGGWITQIQNSLDQTVIQNIRSMDIHINNVSVPSVNLPEVLGSHLLLSPNR